MNNTPSQTHTAPTTSTLHLPSTSTTMTSSSFPELSTCLDMTSLELRVHLEKLPQELFDEIVELVFTPVSGTKVKIKRSRALVKSDPRPQLNIFQVSSNTRKNVAAAYYSNNIFVAEFTNTLDMWLHTLPPSHKLFLTEVHSTRPFVNISELHRHRGWHCEKLLKHGLKGAKFVHYVVCLGELGLVIVI